jgi:cell division inhibitor SulA
MRAAPALHALLDARHVWRGHLAPTPEPGAPTGHAALDAALPNRGWPEHALTEILLSADGVGEIDLLIPTFARLTQAGKPIVLIAPPYVPYAPAWQARGVDLRHVDIIEAEPKHAVWAFEQCLRSGSCAAVLGWPARIDHPALRRLQVAAMTGRALGFVLRDAKHAQDASPAALRLEIDVDRHVRVRKCRGGIAPARAFPIICYQ